MLVELVIGGERESSDVLCEVGDVVSDRKKLVLSPSASVLSVR